MITDNPTEGTPTSSATSGIFRERGMIDTSDAAVTARAERAMLEKHRQQMTAHVSQFGPLGQPMRHRGKKQTKKQNGRTNG